MLSLDRIQLIYQSASKLQQHRETSVQVRGCAAAVKGETAEV